MKIAPHDFAYLISSLFNLYIIKRFMDIFFKSKQDSTPKLIVSYFSYFLITGILYFFVKIPGLMLIANIILLFLIARCYDASVKKQFLAAIYVYFVGFASEVIVTALTMTNLTPFIEYEYSNIVGFFTSKILNFFIVLLIGNAVNIKKHHSMPLWLFLSSTLIPIATIVIEFLVLIAAKTSMEIVIVSIIVLFFINAVVFFLYDSLSAAYDKQLKAVISEQERTYYYNQCLLMQESAEDVRDFKHDMSNHLLLLQNFINEGKEKQAKSYINELTKEYQKIKTVYSATGNIAIDSIINYKLLNVSKPCLHIDVNANVPTEINVEIVDLSVILTNLLDNALTALDKVNGDCRLSVKIIYRKGMLLIQISNSYLEEIQNENGELKTTKEEKKGHGRGLQNVKKTAEKYHGTLRYKYDINTFTAEVILYAS